MAQSYEEGKKLVFYGLKLLGFITIIEVLFALAAKGHIPGVPAFGKEGIGAALYMLAMVGASIYKAYFIVFNFMHMAFEVKGLMLSVLLPCLLLVWAIIAFFHEGTKWGESRELIKEKNRTTTAPVLPKKEGLILEYFGGNRI
jgi:cytochrome c oxidase subunit IV